MSAKDLDSAIPNDFAATVNVISELQRQEALLKAGALQSAIFNSANFSSIATNDAKGVIQIFNVGAERMLGYTAAEVMNKLFLCTALNATESLRSTREDQNESCNQRTSIAGELDPKLLLSVLTAVKKGTFRRACRWTGPASTARSPTRSTTSLR